MIPARGGSKGIPNKNLIQLAGKPLLTYTLKAALASKCLREFVVSTDSEEIATVARESGVTVIMRPAELARDRSPTLDAVVHALEQREFQTGTRYNAIVLLQPTSPLRKAVDIDNSIELFQKHPEAESLISCYDATAYHPEIMYRRDESFLSRYVGDSHPQRRRQDFESVYIRNGAIYIASRRLLLEERVMIGSRPLGFLMSRRASINIDEPEDLQFAGFYFSLEGDDR